MTPEMLLAQTLGKLPTTEKEKLAAKFDAMSISELEGFLKVAGKIGFTANTGKEVANQVRRGGSKVVKKVKDVTNPRTGWFVPNAPGRPAYRADQRILSPGTPELAKAASVEKTANFAGTAIKALAGTGRMKSIGIGMGLGAAGGAVNHMTSNDPNSSLLGSMAGGATMGALGGAAVKGGSEALLRGKGAWGKSARGALKDANKLVAPKPGSARAGAVKPPSAGPGGGPAGTPVPPAPVVNPPAGTAPKGKAVTESADATAAAVKARDASNAAAKAEHATKIKNMAGPKGTIPGEAPPTKRIFGPTAAQGRAMGDTSPGVEAHLKGKKDLLEGVPRAPVSSVTTPAPGSGNAAARRAGKTVAPRTATPEQIAANKATSQAAKAERLGQVKAQAPAAAPAPAPAPAPVVQPAAPAAMPQLEASTRPNPVAAAAAAPALPSRVAPPAPKPGPTVTAPAAPPVATATSPATPGVTTPGAIPATGATNAAGAPAGAPVPTPPAPANPAAAVTRPAAPSTPPPAPPAKPAPTGPPATDADAAMYEALMRQSPRVPTAQGVQQQMQQVVRPPVEAPYPPAVARAAPAPVGRPAPPPLATRLSRAESGGWNQTYNPAVPRPGPRGGPPVVGPGYEILKHAAARLKQIRKACRH